MKKKSIVYCLLIISIITVCAYVFGFSKETKENMKATAKSATQDVKENFTFEKTTQDKFIVKIKNKRQLTEKEKFVIEMKKQLDSVDLRLKKQEENTSALNKGEGEKKQWQTLRENRDKALEKLKEINEATEEQWTNFKFGVKNAFAKLEENID